MFTELIKKDLLLFLKDLKFQIFTFWIILFFAVSAITGRLNLNKAIAAANSEISTYRQQISVTADNMQNLLPEKIKFFQLPGEGELIVQKDGFPKTMTTDIITYHPRFVLSSGTGSGFNLDFMFIIGIIASFAALLFSYNAMSDEKERGTFRLQSVAGAGRVKILFSKFTTLFLLFTVVFGLGIAFAVLLLIIVQGSISMAFLLQISAFYLLSLIFISFFILGGILISLSKNNRAAIIVALSFWLLFIIIIPKTAVVLADKIVPLNSVAENNRLLYEAYNKEYESWWKKYDNVINPLTGVSENHVGGNTYLKDGLRAKAYQLSDEKKSQKKVEILKKHAKQYETYDLIASISPYYLLGKINEIILDLGYFRQQRAEKQFALRQAAVVKALKAADQTDKASLHLFYSYARWDKNVVEDEGLTPFSQKPLPDKNLLTVEYQPAPFSDRFTAVLPWLAALIGLNLIVLSFCVFKTVKYDIR